ncbi:MAG: hypothetical protein JO043_01790, partial [Candidatus Eremiobacteraeota bacterium]|nr:hypothetical protein [Candidatus Eremiobacteraeota bacterium]
MLSLPRCFAASAIVVVFALAVPTVVRGTPRPQLFPNTREGIHLAQVFNYLIPDPRTEIGKVDIVWGASAPIPQSVLNSYYIPFDRDGAAGPGHTLAWWRAHHPDWIEYKCDRKTVAFEFGEKNVPIDIANSAVIAFQMTREATPQLAAGYRGIAWDNVNLNNGFARCGHFALGGKWVQQFTGNSQDPAYEAAVLQWAKTVLVDIHAYSNAVTMWINYSYDTSASYAMNLQLYESTDLLLDESGVTNYGQKRHNRPDPQTWADIFHSVREAEKAGICYEMNGEEPFASPEIPTSERLWVVA